jgi:putative peptidoglycan lipid II flippase
MVSVLKRLWNNEQGIQGAAALLVITMFCSNILGFLRDLVLANTLPLDVLDTYYAAFRLPDFLFNLFILGAISSAFIPIFIDLKTNKGPDEAWRLAHNLIHTALLILILVSTIIFIAMPVLLPHFLPGFTSLKIDATVPIARILLLSPFFFAVSYVLGGALNANKKFFAYSLAPLVYNVSIIAGGFLVPFFGVRGVAWMVVLGALLHVLVQIPSLWKIGYKYSFIINPTDPSLRKVVRLMVPRAISLSMTQFILLFFTRMASLFPSGAISIFTLTNNFQTTPVAIFAASIGTAVFPMLGSAASKKDDEQYKNVLTQSLKGMLFFMIPSMILLWVLRAHIIRLYLALNHQTWDDTIRAIDTFGWFIVALASQGINIIIIRAYYAKQNTRLPMIVSIFGAACTVSFGWYFTYRIGDVSALSLSFALGVTIEAILLTVLFLNKYPKLIDISSVRETIGIALCLSGIAGLLARLMLSIVSEGILLPIEGLGTDRVVPLFLALATAGMVGVGVYTGLAYLLRRSELLWLWPRHAVKSLPLRDSESIATEESIA